MQTLSFVLPITLQENTRETKWRNNPDHLCALRFQFLLRSFLRTFKLEQLDQFLIVCPASDEEEVRDLLGKDVKKSLELKESPDKGVFVKDLSANAAKTHSELMEYMNIGNKNRSVG